jgi:hypothetical protein
MILSICDNFANPGGGVTCAVIIEEFSSVST